MPTARWLKAFASRRSPVVAGWVMSGSPVVAEAMAAAATPSFDAIVIDCQHGLTGTTNSLSLLQALASQDVVPLARSASATDPAWIGLLLDQGAKGIIAPLVNTADDAAQFARACHYPPLGMRSFGPLRASWQQEGYFESANDTVITMAMIETAAGLENCGAIADTSGIDALFIGPNEYACVSPRARARAHACASSSRLNLRHHKISRRKSISNSPPSPSQALP